MQAISAEASAQIGDLAELINPETVLRLFHRAGLHLYRAEPFFTRIHLKKGRALVGFEFQGKDQSGQQTQLRGYVKTFNQPGTAKAIVKQQALPFPTPFGPGVRLLPGGQSVLFLFPYDSGVPGLGITGRKSTAVDLLQGLEEISADGWVIDSHESQFTTLRYLPERRLIFKATLGLRRGGERKRLPVIIRHFPDSRGEKIAETMRALTEKGASYVPRPLGTLMEGAVFVEEWVEGRPLTAQVLSGDGDGEGLACRLLKLHAGLHAGRVKLPIQRSASDLLESLTLIFDKLSDIDPGLGSLTLPLKEALTNARPADRPGVPIHGDFHGGQVLVTASGLVFVDFERMVQGDPLEDPACLAAKMLLQAERLDAQSAERLRSFVTAFATAYLRDGGPRPTTDLAFFMAANLTVRAHNAFRKQAPDWRSIVVSALRLGAKVIAQSAEPADAVGPPAQLPPREDISSLR